MLTQSRDKRKLTVVTCPYRALILEDNTPCGGLWGGFCAYGGTQNSETNEIEYRCYLDVLENENEE